VTNPPEAQPAGCSAFAFAVLNDQTIAVFRRGSKYMKERNPAWLPVWPMI
jgi:hypothetical protein